MQCVDTYSLTIWLPVNVFNVCKMSFIRNGSILIVIQPVPCAWMLSAAYPGGKSSGEYFKGKKDGDEKIGEMVLSWRFAYIWLPQVAQEMFAGIVRLTETTSKLWPRLAAKLTPPREPCLLTPLIEPFWSAASCSVAINKEEFELFLTLIRIAEITEKWFTWNLAFFF